MTLSDNHRISVASVVLLFLICSMYFKSSSATSAISNPLLSLSASQIASAYGKSQVYEITRKGKPIGRHTIQFNVDGNKVEVSVDSSITVRILKVPVYRFRYVAQEQWIDNRLISATATTTENGQSKTVSLENNDRPSNSPIGFTTNHWHPGVLQADSVFNTLTGETNQVKLSFIGEEIIETQSGTLNTLRYRYSFDFEADVWYDENGLWLKLLFLGEDGSEIRYLRQTK